MGEKSESTEGSVKEKKTMGQGPWTMGAKKKVRALGGAVFLGGQLGGANAPRSCEKVPRIDF